MPVALYGLEMVKKAPQSPLHSQSLPHSIVHLCCQSNWTLIKGRGIARKPVSGSLWQLLHCPRRLRMTFPALPQWTPLHYKQSDELAQKHLIKIKMRDMWYLLEFPFPPRSSHPCAGVDVSTPQGQEQAASLPKLQSLECPFNTGLRTY